jgi:hypothetical protein
MDDLDILNRIFLDGPPYDPAEQWPWIFNHAAHELNWSVGGAPEAAAAARLNGLMKLACELGFSEMVSAHLANMPEAVYERLIANAP